MNSSSAPATGTAVSDASALVGDSGAAAGAGVDVAAAIVPANNARTRKLRQVYKNVFRTANNFPSTLPPLTKSLYKGVLCDPIGYSQHGGECWSDTIQQLILFSDELKEFTQPYYYNTPYTTIAKKIDIFVEEPLRDIVKQYVQAMQARFINHYNLIATANPEFESCVSAPDYRRTMIRSDKFKLYRQQSFVSALESARSVSGWEKETSGAKHEQFQALYNILVMLTDADIVLELKLVAEVEPESKVYSYCLRTESYNNLMHMETKTGVEERFFLDLAGGHAVGFFQCGGKLYFYDDNRGPFQTNLPLSDISKLSIILIKRRSADVIFVKGRCRVVLKGIEGIKYGGVPWFEMFIETPMIWRTDSWEPLASDFDFHDIAAYVIKENFALVPKLSGAAAPAAAPAAKGQWWWPWGGGRKRSTRAARRHTRRGKHLR